MPPKILVIDDSPTQALLLAHTLNEYIVEVAGNGVIGLERALDNDYDLLIVDLNLPDLNGQEVCNHYRRIKQNTPIIIVSSEDQLAKIKPVESMGTIYYCVKEAPTVANRVQLIFLRLQRKHNTSTFNLKETVWQN